MNPANRQAALRIPYSQCKSNFTIETGGMPDTFQVNEVKSTKEIYTFRESAHVFKRSGIIQRQV